MYFDKIIDLRETLEIVGFGLVESRTGAVLIINRRNENTAQPHDLTIMAKSVAKYL